MDITSIFSLTSILMVFIGTLLGIVSGSIPGLTATMAVALVLPITYVLNPTIGLAMIMGVYVGSVYGGSISAILINIPGTPASMMTGRDGYPLAQQGKAGIALGVASISSFIGGIISAVILVFIATILGKVALKFGPAEYFSIGIFALSLIAGIVAKNVFKGIIAGLIGVSLNLIGLDPISGANRYTFGIVNLIGGLNLIPLLVGFFGFREVLNQIGKTDIKHKVINQVSKVLPSKETIRHILPTAFRSGILGTYVGILPGAGGPIASFMAYDVSRRLGNNEESFGKGDVRGIASSEAANNATCGGALVPLLTLGIPGDSATAVMLGAFMMHNIMPGPTLFQEHAALVNSIYTNFFIAVFMMLIISLVGAKYFIKVLSIPPKVLVPIITLLCIVGSFAVKNNLFDVWVMMVAGTIGYIMEKRNFPIIATVLGIILGPMIESNLRSALLLGGSSIFFTKPISLSILIITLLIFVWPIIKKKISIKKVY